MKKILGFQSRVVYIFFNFESMLGVLLRGGLKDLEIGDIPQMQSKDTSKLNKRTQPLYTKEKHDISHFDNRYRIVRSIGEGGFGKVYLVEDDFHDGDRLALKLIHPRHQKGAAFEQRFINEIRILRTLQHPGIPQIFNDGKTQEGTIYYTMTYVEGASLEQLLKRYKVLAPLQIVQIVRQMISILDYAHSKGIVHRDLKPSNIILSNFGSENEQVHILDFGIAKILCRQGVLEQAKSMETQKPIGTPHYMAPEQVQGLEVNAGTDLYALGVLIYRMVTGKLPFRGKTSVEIAMARVLKEPEPIADGNTPSSLNALIKKLLSKANKQRPSSEEIHKVLDTLSEGHAELREVKEKFIVTRGFVRPLIAVLLIMFIAYWFKENKYISRVAGPIRTDGDSKQKEQRKTSATTPLVRLETPSNDSHHKTGKILFKGFVQGAVSDHIYIMNKKVPVKKNGWFEIQLDFAPNMMHQIDIRAANATMEDVAIAKRKIIVDTQIPELVFENVNYNNKTSKIHYVSTDSVVLRGKIDDRTPGKPAEFFLNHQPVALNPQSGEFSHHIRGLKEGNNDIQFIAKDCAGNQIEGTIVIVLDRDEPDIELPAPIKSKSDDLYEYVANKHIQISGYVRDNSLNQLWINKNRQDVGKDGSFKFDVDPDNVYIIKAIDKANNQKEIVLKVVFPPRIDLVHPPLNMHVLNASKEFARFEWKADRPLKNVSITAQNKGDVYYSKSLVFKRDNAVASIVDKLPIKRGRNTIKLEVEDTKGRKSIPLKTTISRKPPFIPSGCKEERDLLTNKFIVIDDRAKRISHNETGLFFVYVSAGTFKLPDGTTKEIKPFYIAETETTWRHYHNIVRNNPVKLTNKYTKENKNPVVHILYDEAKKYCEWANLDLPTYNQWMWAAVGKEGGHYPWGDRWEKGRCNSKEDDKFGSISPVMQFKGDRSWCGAYDMAGNVSEWCIHPQREKIKTLCGGNYRSGKKGCNLLEKWLQLPEANNCVGFRVVLNLE